MADEVLADLSFGPTSGAQVNITYASMNAWAAEPFCQEGRPGTSLLTMDLHARGQSVQRWDGSR